MQDSRRQKLISSCPVDTGHLPALGFGGNLVSPLSSLRPPSQEIPWGSHNQRLAGYKAETSRQPVHCTQKAPRGTSLSQLPASHNSVCSGVSVAHCRLATRARASVPEGVAIPTASTARWRALPRGLSPSPGLPGPGSRFKQLSWVVMPLLAAHSGRSSFILNIHRNPYHTLNTSETASSLCLALPTLSSI